MAPPKGERSPKRVKVWKGEKHSGPTPARHIPWPEIFQHHISVCDGHAKMLEMVQKHTVQGTNNYTTITNLVNRGHEMLRQAEDIARNIVILAGQREMVPLGSSSDSLFPGYSPAHIEYGQAASEFGRSVGGSKGRGENWESSADAPEYKLGQAHGAKRNTLLKKDGTDSTDGDGNSKEAAEKTKPAEETEGMEDQYFIIDTNPTPFSLPNRVSKAVEIDNDEEKNKKDKKKRKRESERKEKEVDFVVETEDISAEVDARLKAKEEKSKAKVEKKRRRESSSDEFEKVVKKLKKEKSRKREMDVDSEEVNSDGESKKRRRRSRKKKDKNAE